MTVKCAKPAATRSRRPASGTARSTSDDGGGRSLSASEAEEARTTLDTIFSRHGAEPGKLVPILQDIQDDFGYLPRLALSAAATFLRVPEKTVFGVATFYTAFSLTPRGRFRISVCLGTACHVRSGAQILDRLERELKIRSGETTQDRLFSIEAVRCLGCCGLAPVFAVNGEVHGKVTQSQVPRVLDKYRTEAGMK